MPDASPSSGVTDLVPLLEGIRQRLRDDFGLVPVVACEIEFYLIGISGLEDSSKLLDDILSGCRREGVDLIKIEEEWGNEQHEIALRFTKDLTDCAEQVVKLKKLLSECSLRYGITADFSSKFHDRLGSGLHVHVHLENEAGQNQFFRQRENDQFSPTLLNAIGGLLATMKQAMPVFAPSPASLARFVPGSHAPTTISWGTNNRTVAVRLPTKPYESKHLEHRVAGADADPYAVIAAVLGGIYYGLKHKSDPGEPIYGDAALEMYQKQPITDGLTENWPPVVDVGKIVKRWLE